MPLLPRRRRQRVCLCLRAGLLRLGDGGDARWVLGPGRQTFENLKVILEAVGSDLVNVVKVNAYLTDLTRFARFNEVYVEFFGAGPPARTTVGADLLGILVEVDCVAVVRADGQAATQSGRRHF